VKSDWVRAEAGVAKKDAKLIPVKAASLSYDDIPLPFGDMHTENITSFELIKGAVVAQLAKPVTPVSPLQETKGLFKYNALSWVSIIGGSLTLFGTFKVFLSFADWAQWVIDHWDEKNRLFWHFVLGWAGIQIPKQFVPYCTFTLFIITLVIGVNFGATREERSTVIKSMKEKMTRPLKQQFSELWVYIIFLIVFPAISMILGPPKLPLFGTIEVRTPVMLMASLLCLLPFFFMPRTKTDATKISKDRHWYRLSAVLNFIIASVLLGLPVIRGHASAEFVPLAFFLLSVPLVFTPLKPLAKRLSFLVMGTLLLFALNEVSKLHLIEYLSPA
jgi:hypothetical protein